MRRRVLILALIAAAAAFLAPARGSAQGFSAAHVRAELVSEAAVMRPGEPFWAGVRLVMEPGWHVYWKNPGDSGLPTTVEWILPPGWSAGPLQWPVPSRFPYSGVMTYGYAGELLLMARITPASGTAVRGTAPLRARAAWLACSVECVPGAADLDLSLPVGSKAALDPLWSESFARARASLPQPLPSASARREGGGIALEAPGVDAAPGEEAYFFAESTGVVAASKEQVVRARTPVRLLLEQDDGTEALPPRIAGVLSVGDRGYAVDAALAPGVAAGAPAAGASGAAPGAAAGTAAPGRISLLLAVVFAFLGGLILNLMPCVLPVLSLKVLGFVREARSLEAGEPAGRARSALAHGLSFTAGVLVMFWALLGALLAARAGGSLLGWGFQFQSPGFVAAMALLIFILGLNMLGVFELGVRAGAAGAGLSSRKGLLGSFFTGFLAVIAATPCTAPFMGSALGFALTQPAPAAFAVFTALAAGMAAPSLALSASPRLLSLVPKPGRWMESLKQAMGFLMMAVVVWLAWLFSSLAGGQALSLLIGALAAAALGAWIYGRWGGLERTTASRIVSAVLAVFLVGAAFVFSITWAEGGAGAVGRETGRQEEIQAPENGTGWQTYSEQGLARLRAEGVPVFIDFSARWCLTCIANERFVLDSSAVKAALKENGVALLRADWTDRNDAVARALAGYGRSGVPLYVLYGPGASGPVILPEILTPGIVVDTLRRTIKTEGGS